MQLKYFLLLGLLLLPARAMAQGPTVWVVDSLTRVGKTDAAGGTTSISVSGARGEWIDSQVIIKAPAGGLTNANVTATAMTGPGTIAASNWRIYREWYVTVGSSRNLGGTNPPLGAGTYPDGLIPFQDPDTGASTCSNGASITTCPFTVTASQNQPIWLDLFVPRGSNNSPTGTYTGTIHVTSTQGNVDVAVTLTLWNFELPIVPSEQSDFTYYAVQGSDTSGFGRTIAYGTQMMRHRIMPTMVPVSDAINEINNFGMTDSFLEYYNNGCTATPAAPTVATFQSQVNAYPLNRADGTTLPLYVKAWDEINGCTSIYPTIKAWAANMHSASTRLFNAITMTPDPALYVGNDGLPAVDVFILLPKQWPVTKPPAPIKLWTYSAVVQDNFSPNWHIDFPLIDERIQAGFLSVTQGAVGLLYYCVNCDPNPWTDSQDIGFGPGDGNMLYPGSNVGITSGSPAPSLRFKALRDGFQDYEYYQVAVALGQKGLADSQIQPIATSWSNWTQSNSSLLAARTAIGNRINLINGATSPIASLSTSTLAFSPQTINTTSAAQGVTLTNTGNATLTISSITITGTNSGDFGQTNGCGASLTAGSTCTISVTFTPTATGSRVATLNVNDNASGSPQTVAFSGTGVSANPVVSLSPASNLTFGNQLINTTSLAQAETLTNTGTVSLTITSIAVTGTNSGDFAQSNNCGSSLAANASCTANVTFTPTALGNRTALLAFTDNASGSPQNITLTGTSGLSPPPNCPITGSGTFSGTGMLTCRGVNPILVITSAATLPSATVGVAYSFTFSVTGGIPPYTWSGATICGGISMASIGVYSGTPLAVAGCPGTNIFTVSVADSATPTANTANGSFTIVVN